MNKTQVTHLFEELLPTDETRSLVIEALSSSTEISSEDNLLSKLQRMHQQAQNPIMGWVTFNPDNNFGESKKIQNLSVNYKTFIKNIFLNTLDATVGVAVSTFSLEVAACLGGLCCIKSCFDINSHSSITLNQCDAMMAYTLHVVTYHEISGFGGPTDSSNLNQMYNKLATTYSIPTINLHEAEKALISLASIKAVYKKNDSWHPKEIAQIKLQK